MHYVQYLLCSGTALVMAWAIGDVAGDQADPAQDRIQRKKVEARPARGKPGTEDLVPPKTLEKLDLNKEQKAKFDKINQEFQEKQKDLRAKVQAAYKNRDRNTLTEARQAQQKLAPDYRSKVEGVLTDAQKKILEEVRGTNPPARPEPRPGLRQAGTEVGPLVPPQLQESLKLTGEQKQKLADIQKDAESKIRTLLTEEQRKLLDQTKKSSRTPR